MSVSPAPLPALPTAAASVLANDILDSLSVEVAVLDRTGTIIKANDFLHVFAPKNGAGGAALPPGTNFMAACRQAQASGDAMAGQVVQAVEAVLQGKQGQWFIDYTSASPGSARGFLMRVTPLKSSLGGVVLASHEVAELQATMAALRKAQQEIEGLDYQHHGGAVCLGVPARPPDGALRIVGQTPAIRRVLAQAKQVASTNATVLLLGETGTGKELLAAFIHQSSSRRDRAMVSVNCAAMPTPLLESEMFGREKGAFTGALSRQIGRFELADGSSIFLDEIGDLSLDMQAKLLRVLEARQIERLGNPKSIPVNVRIIVATNRDLEQAVAEGSFRKDLYYRINVFPILVPLLRERREDIPLLVWAFVNEFAKTFNRDIHSIEPESMEALQRYPWPGNVRELRNLVERAMIVAHGPTLRIQLPATPPPSASAGGARLADVEREHILGVLQKCGWRIRGANAAAETLGLKPTTLEARMAKLGIHRPGCEN